MRKALKIIITLIILTITIPYTYADRGMIPIRPEISVYEPGQKAIIAWNGIEEILILSTDVKSSEDTIALEILPLPSKPLIQKADFKSFEELQKIIMNKGFEMYRVYGRSLGDIKGLEIIFHEKIGVHDITIVKASNARELMYWMENYLRENNITQKPYLESLEEIIQDYIDMEFQYYSIDLITISKIERSVNPILYRFNTSFLYYPLKISSLIPGQTQITIFTITKERIRGEHPQLKRAHYITSEMKYPIEFQISKDELNKIDMRISELFNENAWLTVLEYKGHLNTLKSDLKITIKQTEIPIYNITIIIITLAITITIMKIKEIRFTSN
ncbi:MAG: DUF2330 domain-containing protein [Candidatus Methanomethylicia archaeon]